MGIGLYSAPFLSQGTFVMGIGLFSAPSVTKATNRLFVLLKCKRILYGNVDTISQTVIFPTTVTCDC